MLPQPKTKFDEYVDVINQMSISQTIDTLVLARIKKDVRENLINVDPVEAYVLLGIIASLENKPYSVVVDYFKRASRIDSNSWNLFQNYAVALMKLGFVSEAYEIGLKALDLARVNQEILGYAKGIYIDACVASFRLNEVANFDKEWLEIGKFLTERGIADSDLKVFAEILEQIASEDVLFIQGAYRNLSWEDDRLYIKFELRMDAQIASHLSDKLIDRFIERDLSPRLTRHIGVGFLAV